MESGFAGTGKKRDKIDFRRTEITALCQEPRYRIREITNAGGRTQRPAIRAHTHRDVFKRGHALAPQHHPGVSKGLS